LKDNLLDVYKRFIKEFNFNDDEKAYGLFFEYLLLIESKEILGNHKNYRSEIEDSYISFMYDNLYSKKRNSYKPEIIGRTFERIINRKSIGAYYTPQVVTNYMTKRSLDTALQHFELNEIRILDPTCGAGAFLEQAFRLVVELRFKAETNSQKIDDVIIETSKQIYGLDISDIAVEISRFRLNILALEYGLNVSKIGLLQFNLYVGNAVYEETDIYLDEIRINKYIEDQAICFEEWKKEVKPFNFSKAFKNINVIVGNPPYIEFNKIKSYVTTLSSSSCGNIYAPILEKSYNLLGENGVLGMIIPISFSTTKRMNKIFYYIYQHSEELIIENYADRPGSLFSGVHQKLNIIFAKKKNEGNCKLKTSDYIHFSSDEIEHLFKDRKEYLLDSKYIAFKPKLCSKVESSIFSKVINVDRSSFFKKEANYKLFLSRRACFWMKTFLNEKNITNDYMELSLESLRVSRQVYSILNSSLFFWFWEKISDCWHVRKTDIDSFNFDIGLLHNELIELSYIVEKKLEETKVYIGSKQIDYEYKHKKIKDILDLIDIELAKLYGLTDQELEYILNYKLKYRLSDHFKVYTRKRGGKCLK